MGLSEGHLEALRRGDVQAIKDLQTLGVCGDSTLQLRDTAKSWVAEGLLTSRRPLFREQ